MEINSQIGAGTPVRTPITSQSMFNQPVATNQVAASQKSADGEDSHPTLNCCAGLPQRDLKLVLFLCNTAQTLLKSGNYSEDVIADYIRQLGDFFLNRRSGDLVFPRPINPKPMGFVGQENFS